MLPGDALMCLNPSDPKEQSRIQKLYSLEILDSSADVGFDEITRFASRLCEAPIAMVCIIDESRIWLKSRVGCDYEEIPREFSCLCDLAIRGPSIFAVGDFDAAGIGAVAAKLGIRSYMGYPLTTQDGFAIGALVVGDREQREFSALQREGLEVLGKQIIAQIDLRHGKLLLSRKRETIEMICHTGRQLSRELEVRKLAQALTDGGRELCEAEFGAFFYDSDNSDGENRFVCVLSVRDRARFEGFPLPWDLSVLWRGMKKAAVVRVDDVRRDPRLAGSAILDALSRSRPVVTSLLGIPISFRGGEVLGRLFFGHSAPARFDRRHEMLLEGLAFQAAIAMDNAQLFERLKRSLHQMHESRERFSQVMENLGEAIWMVDLDTKMPVYLSPGFEKIWGRSVESAMSDPGTMLAGVHLADRDRLLEALPQRVLGEYDIEYRVVRPDGSIRWVHDRAFPVRDGSGRIYRVCGIVSDITEMKEAYRLLDYQRAKLVAASKMSALGEMAGGIAHEINNPLAIIHAKANQIKTLADAGKVDPALVSSTGEKIAVTAMRIAKIVKALRSFARDAEQDPFQDCSVRLLVEETIEFCRERFRNHSVELRVDPIDEGLTLRCRPVQISQVLLNLLNNSHDAVESLPEKWVAVGVRATGETVELVVTDSGKGIPPEIRERILEPFFTTKEAGKGTGLGLSVSKGIVEGHDGTLRINSECPNTQIVVVLPVESERQQLPKAG